MARDDDAVSENPQPDEGKKPAKPPAIPNLSIDDDDDRPRKKPTARDDDDDDDDRPRKKSARDDDDDDDDRPRKKKSRDEEEDDDDDRPRKKKSRDDDDDEEDDDRPRKKKRSRDDDDEDDDRRGKKKKGSAMPGMLMAAAIVALAWGGMNILGNCGTSVIAFQDWNAMRQVDRMGFGKLVEAIGGVGQGYFLTLGIAYLLLVLAAVVLTLGGVLLLLRKAAGKFVTIGGAAAMAFVTLAGTGAGLIISRFGFFGGIFAGLPVVFFFTLCAGGFLIFALMDKDVNRALR